MSEDAVMRDVSKVLEGFDCGYFVRSTGRDHDSNWAIELAPYLLALARLAKAADQAEDAVLNLKLRASIAAGRRENQA